MGQYYWEKTNSRHYVVRYTRFGGNSEIVATFSTLRGAKQYVFRKNGGDNAS